MSCKKTLQRRNCLTYLWICFIVCILGVAAIIVVVFLRHKQNSPQVITSDKSSENVVIPDPPKPKVFAHTRCPHWDASLKRWNDPATWEYGRVPKFGNVTIPEGTRVLIDETLSPYRFGVITIPPTSKLVFGEADGGISLTVRGILVEGSLVAGSESCRLQKQITITLTGERPHDIVENPLPEYEKGIAVKGGRLQLHGKRYYRTWTRLAANAEAGDSELLVRNRVNWEEDQEIVLVTTAVKDSREWHQNEVLIVKRTESRDDHVVVKLKSRVQFAHIANSGYQAEVGLLSRTITIQGSKDDSDPIDPDPLTCTGLRFRHGDYGRPCENTELTGYGGHVIVYERGLAYVQGVELLRMGQTNVIGRYPMNFHMLGGNCTGCYFQDSSVHQSYYRGAVIPGTNNVTVRENVAYDIVGHCYYLEDGSEENNTVSFNLAAHVHILGTPATGSLSYQGHNLTQPADTSASGFYIPNLHNNIIGNAASGGWTGFFFPVLSSQLATQRNNTNMRPSNRPSLVINGNTAHSTGWWWDNAGAFYFGGSIYYEGNTLVYNSGKDASRPRSPCLVDPCDAGNCSSLCVGTDQAWNRITNSKAFLVPSAGLTANSGRLEVIGFEAHDVALSLEGADGRIWIDDMLVVCRSGDQWVMPRDAKPNLVSGNGFFWQETEQKVILTNSTFRNCGYRSDSYSQYESSPERGCDGNNLNGCMSSSTVFGLQGTSNANTPDIMKITADIRFENCGRRFMITDASRKGINTVGARGQNWLDTDGSVSGLGEPVLIGSGVWDAGKWWKVDKNVVKEPQGPLVFIKTNDGVRRGVGHIRMEWDPVVHDKVGVSVCGPNDRSLPCPALGKVRHFGPMFRADPLGGLPITANAVISGPVGGYGWLVSLNGGAPHSLVIDMVEVDPSTPLVLGIAYPTSTNFNITAKAPPSCVPTGRYSCEETFQEVNSASQVRNSDGNTFHFDRTSGLLTIRVIQPPTDFTGDTLLTSEPSWHLWNWISEGRNGKGYALDRFSRAGVMLPKFAEGAHLEILADCPRAGAFCDEQPPEVDPQVCSPGFVQTSHDKCCKTTSPEVCEYPS